VLTAATIRGVTTTSEQQQGYEEFFCVWPLEINNSRGIEINNSRGVAAAAAAAGAAASSNGSHVDLVGSRAQSRSFLARGDCG